MKLARTETDPTARVLLTISRPSSVRSHAGSHCTRIWARQEIVAHRQPSNHLPCRLADRKCIVRRSLGYGRCWMFPIIYLARALAEKNCDWPLVLNLHCGAFGVRGPMGWQSWCGCRRCVMALTNRFLRPGRQENKRKWASPPDSEVQDNITEWVLKPRNV